MQPHPPFYKGPRQTFPSPPYGSHSPAQAGPPGPVMTVSVLLYVFAGLSVLAALVLAAGGALGAAMSDVPVADRYGGRIALVGIGGAALMIALAGVDIVLGISLWKGRRWARTVTIGLAAVSVLVAMAAGPGGLVIDLAVAGLLVVLLTAPTSTRQFFASAQGSLRA